MAFRFGQFKRDIQWTRTPGVTVSVHQKPAALVAEIMVAFLFSLSFEIVNDIAEGRDDTVPALSAHRLPRESNPACVIFYGTQFSL